MAHLTLFEFNHLIKTSLENHTEPDYWVVAEISEMRLNQKGHCYMEMVEKEGHFVTAKIRANIWAYTYRNLSAAFESVAHTPLKPGLKIRFNAKINFHEVYGLSLTIQDVDPKFTLGERARKRQEVINQLVKDGVFDLNKNLSLPEVPQRIAVISSETAAGYGDFLNQLKGNPRSFAFKTELFQALMQGDKAPESIIKALLEIHERNEEFDLTVIIRGGGGQADLDCFDDYELASHVAQFSLPVITGIGHERDVTITDLVAHTQMKTPTAVAEFLALGLEKFDDCLNEAIYRIEKAAISQLQFGSLQLQSLGNQLQVSARSHIGLALQKLINQSVAMKFASHEQIKLSGIKLQQMEMPLKRVIRHQLERQQNQLALYEKTLELASPQSVLKRGYTITKINGQLPGKAQLLRGDLMETITADATISSEIKSIN